MAATTQNQDDENKVIQLAKPLKGIAGRGRKKRLPALSAADIEDFFSNADNLNARPRQAA